MFALLRISGNINSYPLIQPPWSLFPLENVWEAEQIHPFPEDGAWNRHWQKKNSCAPWRYMKVLLKRSYPASQVEAELQQSLGIVHRSVCLHVTGCVSLKHTRCLIGSGRTRSILIRLRKAMFLLPFSHFHSPPPPPLCLLLLFIIFSIYVCWKHPLTLFPCSSLGWWFTAPRW